MKRKIFWNRRSSENRRARGNRQIDVNNSDNDDQRLGERRLYGENDYLLIIGHTGLDRFTLLVSAAVLVLAVIVLFLDPIALF